MAKLGFDLAFTSLTGLGTTVHQSECSGSRGGRSDAPPLPVPSAPADTACPASLLSLPLRRPDAPEAILAAGCVGDRSEQMSNESFNLALL